MSSKIEALIGKIIENLLPVMQQTIKEEVNSQLKIILNENKVTNNTSSVQKKNIDSIIQEKIRNCMTPQDNNVYNKLNSIMNGVVDKTNEHSSPSIIVETPLVVDKSHLKDPRKVDGNNIEELMMTDYSEFIKDEQ